MSGEDTVLTRVNGRPTILNIEDNVHLYTNASGAVAVGDVVYVASNNTVAKADADADTYPPIGLVQKLNGATECYVVHSGGIATGLSGLTAGKPYYLSNTAGSLAAAPSSAGTYLIGVAINATSLAVCCVPANMVAADTASNTLMIGAESDPATWDLPPTSSDGIHVQDKVVIIAANSADANSGSIAFNKSRGASDGSHGLVSDDDSLGGISFTGSDGAGQEFAAKIEAAIDGTAANNDMPGRVVISTTPVNSTTPAERMRITSSGKVGIGLNNPSHLLDVNGDIRVRGNDIRDNSGNAAISFDGSANTEVVNTLIVNQVVGVGTSSPTEVLTLNATEPTILFKEGGTDMATIGVNSSDNILIENKTMNKHIVFKANDQGTVREGLRLDGAVPEVVVNQQHGVGGDNSLIDFRVESDNSTHMLFVDGSADAIGVDISAPKTALDVHHDPTSLADNTGGGEAVTFGTGNLTAGKLYFLNSSGAWTETDADSVSTSDGLLGIALGASPSDGVLLRGFFDATTYLVNFISGLPVYLSTTAASMDTTQPSGTGDIVRCVGYCTNTANVIYFNPEATFLELS
tara:strand:- start:1467 stop:3197 length:1731 start_codon:yes stop_codon:yes gene_type:complete